MIGVEEVIELEEKSKGKKVSAAASQAPLNAHSSRRT